MKLTVAFITKNRCNELRRAINSCFSQQFSNVQYVVVDNGSTDNTVDFLHQLEESEEINVKICCSAKNLGVAGGRNKAIEISDGEYVLFLDDDAEIQSNDLFSTICNYLDEHDEVGALALKIYDEKTNRFLEGPLSINAHEDIADVLQFIGGAHVIRYALFKNRKLYPSKLGYGSEELYASMRIRKMGYSIKYLKNVLIRHYPSTSNRMIERERQYNILLNIYLVKMLTYPLVFRAITKIVFVLRLIKNRYTSLEDIGKLTTDIDCRYQKSEEDRVSYKLMFRLISTYSLKHIV